MIRVRLLVRPELRRAGALLMPNWLAITLGRTIVTWRRLDPAELAHELTHVRQWERHGRAGFVARYAAASVRARLSGHDWYRDNTFEREAAEAAGRAGGGGSHRPGKALPFGPAGARVRMPLHEEG